MTRTISRISVSTNVSVTSPSWPLPLDTGRGTASAFPAPRDSKTGRRARSSPRALFTRGAAGCNAPGASSGANTGGGGLSHGQRQQRRQHQRRKLLPAPHFEPHRCSLGIVIVGARPGAVFGGRTGGFCTALGGIATGAGTPGRPATTGGRGRLTAGRPA